MIIVAVMYVISLIYTFSGYSFPSPTDRVIWVIDAGMTALLSPLFLLGGILELFFGPLEEI